MEYITVKEAAEKWGVTARRVQILCSQNRIVGAIRFGNRIMIPRNAKYPVASVDAVPSQDQQAAFVHLPRNTPFLHMTDLYSIPGSADVSAQKLFDNEEARALFEAEIAYSRGQIDQVYASVQRFLDTDSTFFSVISAGMLLALCAIWRGDLTMWRRAKQHIAHAPAQTDHDRDVILLAITAVDSMLYDVESFPEWFKIGCFEPLPKDSLPAANVYYAKYLYASAYAVATKQVEVAGVKGLALMGILPLTLEPMISQVAADGIIMAEAYLRMTCATIYHNSGNDAQAIRHLDKALSLVLPDKLYGFLAEYCRPLGPILEQRLMLVDPLAWKNVKELYKIYNAGWSKLSGIVRGRTIITTLSPREREVAKLAAFGMTNNDIAEKLHMSLPGVKQAIRIASEKTGVSRDEFAAYL